MTTEEAVAVAIHNAGNIDRATDITSVSNLVPSIRAFRMAQARAAIYTYKHHGNVLPFSEGEE